MGQIQCEVCGEVFNSRMNFEHHRDLIDCGSEEEDGPPSSDADETPTDERAELTYDLPVEDADGTVQYYDEDGGFGFVFTNDIVPERFQGRIEVDDVFFYVTNIDADTVEVGDRLRFDVVEGDDGPRARELELVERRGGSDDSALENRQRRKGFDHDKDGGKHGPGKESPTESDIEQFRDERKFQ